MGVKGIQEPNERAPNGHWWNSLNKKMKLLDYNPK